MLPARIDRYRIEARLGEGGMGEVFRAVDEKLGRTVALKAMLAGTEEGDDRRRRRLEREARALAAVVHPSIAQLYDVVSEGGRDFLVMEYVVGRTLAEVLAAGRLPLVDALRIAGHLAEGLETAHGTGIVHRDLKPANVIVTPDGRAKILDFGLAKLREDPYRDSQALTRDGEVVGTLSAMSPEQVAGEPVDHRSDLFSLGALLYQMLTGVHPFKGPTPPATMQRIASHEPEPVRRLAPEVPAEVAELTHHLLAKRPDRRPASATAVLEVLGRHLEPTRSLTAVGARAALAHGLRGRWWWVAGVLAAAGAALVGAVWSAWTAPPPLRVVAVPAVRVDPGSPDPEALAVTARGVRRAAVSALAAVRRVEAVEPAADLAGPTTPTADVAGAVGATEVLLANLGGGPATCWLDLRLVAADDGRTLWSDGFEVPIHDHRLVRDAVAVHLVRAFPDRPVDRAAAMPEVDAEVLAELLKLERRRELEPESVALSEVLETLRSLRRRAPAFLALHLEEANLARYLYQATEDEAYLERGREVVEAALRIAPADPRTLEAEAELWIAAGDAGNAAAALTRLAESAPEHAERLALESRVAELEGDLERARELCLADVARRRSAETLRSAAYVEQKLGRVDDARSHLEEARQLAPQSLAIRSNLAELELLGGDPRRAAELYAELAELRPRPNTLANLATAQLLSGDCAAAVVTYRRVLDGGMRHPAVRLGLADCLLLTGAADEAAAHYDDVLRSLEASATTPDAADLGLRAQALAHLGRSVDAVTVVQQALRLAPESPETLFDAALVFAVVGDRSSAASHRAAAVAAGMGRRWFELPWFDGLPPLDDPR